MDFAEQDVVIVGAGPAGSALAIELCDCGLKVLLVDKAKFPRDKPCGDYVSPKGLLRLQELGIGKEIIALGSQPISSSKLYLNSELLVSGDLPRLDNVPDHGLALPRKHLDMALFERAQSRDVPSLEGFRVTGFEKRAGKVCIEGLQDKQKLKIKTRLVVGADGANSVIAKQAGLESRDPRYVLASVRAYVHGLTIPHTIMFFDERFFPGYGWVFPIRPGLCNIGVGMVKEPLIRDGVKLLAFYEQFKLLVHRLADANGQTIDIEPHCGFPIKSYGGARQNYFDGGILIGEAASFVDPINGEGIPLALDSAEIAAREIKRYFNSGDLSENSLSAYENAWRNHFDPDLGISDLVVSLLRNRSMQAVWVSLFKTMSFTAQRDKKYADITGGVLGGVVPARKAITPEMFVRALAHPPSFWRDVYNIEEPFDLRQWSARGKKLLSWQTAFSKQLFSKDSWTRDWIKEIAAKQASVVAKQVTVNHYG